MQNKIEIVAVDKIKPHPENKIYQIPEDSAFKASVATLGVLVALVVSKLTGFIISGNRRYFAALECGLTHVPVKYVEVTAEEEKLFLITYNQYRDKLISEKLGEIALIRSLIEENPENKELVFKHFNLEGANGKTTRQILAPIVKYSETYLSRLEHIHKVNPELIHLIDRGELTINKAYEMTRGKEKAPSVKKSKLDNYCAECPRKKLAK